MPAPSEQDESPQQPLNGLIAETVRRQQDLLERLVPPRKGERGKDFWDKFSTVSTFLSGVVIATVGLFVTNWISDRQDERSARIAGIGALPDFMPLLRGTDEEQTVALMATRAMGQWEIAIRLAGMLSRPETESAPKQFLRNVALTSAEEAERQLARQELDRLDKLAAARNDAISSLIHGDVSRTTLQTAISAFPFDRQSSYTVEEAQSLLRFIGATDIQLTASDSVTGRFPGDVSVTVWPNSYGLPVYGIRYGRSDLSYWGSNETLFNVTKSSSEGPQDR